mmetsp:Transcript_8800/g.19684  ORF Transcript_8800/g.19684 Transcript_8800/m.19684 type:complete len:425 (-) Transcript_8800:134-1408(-)
MGAVGGETLENFSHGQLRAWLLKKKSGRSMLRMRQYNKRFFTIDFDSCVFYYAHNEKGRKVSCLMPFSDILGAAVESPSMQDDKKGLVKRSFSNASNLGEAHFKVTIHLHKQKKLELLCGSDGEALQWYEAFMTAKARGNVLYGTGANAEAGSMAAAQAAWAVARGDAESSGDEQGSPMSGAGQAATGALSALAQQCSPPAASKLGATPVSPAVQGFAPNTDGPDAEERRSPGEDTENAPQRQPGMFLDLSVEEPAQPAGLGNVDTGVMAPHSEGVPNDQVVETVEAITMQAADFGFEDNDSSDDDSEGSEPAEMPFFGIGGGADRATSSTDSARQSPGHSATMSSMNMKPPSPAGVGASHGVKEDADESEEGDLQTGDREGPLTGVGAAPAKAGMHSYVDRHQGLSMQERLNNLEFSDDEDES